MDGRRMDHIEFDPSAGGIQDSGVSAGGEVIDGGVLGADLNAIEEKHSSGSILSRIGLDDKSFFEESGTVKLPEIKAQLNSDSDKEKLLAMKRLFAMISKGRDVSSLFPDVIKNVIAQNVEIRKLVYMFIVHYSEVEPQSALLGINSLQKAMSDHNQMLRASALRCMSNIRVKDIAQLIVLSVQKGAKDSSAHARRTAALAVPKILRLDPRHREQCEELVGMLLKDYSSVVLGAAIAAFLEVCPERLDLVHPVFRRLCKVLPEMDEWGQVAALSLLLRYSRSQFTNPDPTTHKKPSGEVDEDWVMDPDHRAMLAASSQLMHSRNTAVVLGAAVLHFYSAPPSELVRPARALVRLLHSGREAQYVALANIATLAAKFPNAFGENLSEFFVRAGEPAATRVLKLEVLTRLANERNISRILKEMREYVKDENKNFVASAIQAIGRCAATIPEVAETCLHQLLQLMASPSPQVASESVVVIKRLLQLSSSTAAPAPEKKAEDSIFSGAVGEADKRQQKNRGSDESQRDVRVIRQLARLLDKIKSAQARASIVWVAGEYCSKVPQRSPDVLRALAKSFADEEALVKLQVINLGAKLHLMLTAPESAAPQDVRERSEAIFRYVLQLAKYDTNYDVRDRARVVRQLLFGASASTLRASATRLFLTEKPVPVSATESDASSPFTLGTLSHVVHESAPGYEPLPDFPEEAPDPSVRNLAPGDIGYEAPREEPGMAAKRFEDAMRGDGEDDDDGAWVEETGEGDEEVWGEAEGEADEREAAEWGAKAKSRAYADDSDALWGAAGDEEAEEPAEEKDDDEAVWGAEPEAEPEAEAEEEPEEDDIWNPKPAAQPKAKAAAAPAKKAAAPAKKRDPLEDLFSLGDAPATTDSTPALSAEIASLSSGLMATGIAPTIGAPVATSEGYHGPATTERATLLKPVVSGGLSAEYCFARRPSLYGNDVLTVLVSLRNTRADRAVASIRVGKVLDAGGDDGRVVPFPELRELPPMQGAECPLSMHFSSFSKPIRFEICTADGAYPVTIAPPPGDLIRPPMRPLSLQEFTQAQKKLGGMFACEQKIDLSADVDIEKRVQEAAYVAVVSNEGAEPVEGEAPVARFASETMTNGQQVIVVVSGAPGGPATVSVHCENTAAGSMLLKSVVASLTKK